MAFTINLYQFNKKHNSTATPTGTGTALTCDIKSGTSIIAPVAILKTNPSSYNYAYIATFNRYYFIDNISYDFGVWSVAMICDVLATYKADIGAASLMVERAASASDGNIIDGLRLTKATYTASRTQLEPFNSSSGYYVLKVLSGSGSGSIAYQMPPGDFKTFLNNMLPALEGWQPGDILQSFSNALANPTQYITGCHWFPEMFPSGGAVGSIALGPVSVGGLSGTSVVDITGTTQTSQTYSISKHPQAVSAGNFANLAPFSQYAVDYPPFGLIELDPSKLINNTTIGITLLRDAYTGEGRLTITSGSNILAEIASQFGVPIPVSQSGVEMGSIVAGVAESFAKIASENYAGAAASLVSAASSAAPTVRTLGSRGSIAGVRAAKYLYEKFNTITPIDITNQGAPLQAVRTINTLSGYIQTASGDIVASGATLQELETIRNYLTGGFYYE